MKYILLITLFFFSLLPADELTQAYQKEYAFLKAQKEELSKRLRTEKEVQQHEISEAKQKVQKLQNKLVQLSKSHDELQKKIDTASQTLQEKESNKNISSSVVIQAQSLLQQYDVTLQNTDNTTLVMKEAFEKTAQLYTELSSLRKTEGSFYLLDGTTTKGSVLKVGNIAAYGVAKTAAGALAPAGNGEYKLWNQDASADAHAFMEGKMTKEIRIFIYENLDKDVEYKKEKTIQDTIEGGGTIGYIILVLGALGLLLIFIRMILLIRAGSNVKKITTVVVQNIQDNADAKTALEAIKGFKGATARVIKATLRNIDKDRDHIEDIITENIINESSNIDRFGSFVLVLAAVAPLLGLLGTVTGMIATFDIITEFGTGDPKLLSGGISEALVTTMLGLVVAIPLLLLGNLLSGWAQNIKDSMEYSALHIVNIFQDKKAQ